MSPHLPDLATALLSAAITVGLALGYIWWLCGPVFDNAPVMEEPERIDFRDACPSFVDETDQERAEAAEVVRR